MGLFDSLSGGLKNALEQAETAALPALISGVLAKTSLGNMQGLWISSSNRGLDRRYPPGLVTEKTCRSQPTNFVQHWEMGKFSS